MSRMEAKKDQYVGGAKETTGKVIGNEQWQAEGKAQKAKGEATEAAIKAKERTKGTGEQVKGGLKEGAGTVLGNEQMKYEGKAERKKGEIRKKANQ